MGEYCNGQLMDGVLVIRLAGRIDSANAAVVQEELDALRARYPAEAVTLDADELSYISSAGLRVLLRLRKACREMKIINVSSEIYGIFEMTGFTEMFTIEKGYRRISVEGCEVIGKGANGEVYRIDPDTIVKVYENPDSLPDIRHERELARKAFVLGIPTAIPYDVVRVGNTYGSVFELLNAKSFSKIIMEEPGRMEEMIHLYADLLKKIHATEVDPADMPDIKPVALKWVGDIKGEVPEETWEKLHALVEAVPENHHMLHGDYHTKNVMLQDGEALLIDMDTLSRGDPVFEFAAMFNAYKGFYDGRPPVTGPSFLGITYEQGLTVFEETLKLYFGTEDEKLLTAVKEKAALIGYARLLRRILRRSGVKNAEDQAAVDYLKGAITELTGRIDTLAL